MINLENCKKLFKKYVENYDMENDKIYLKYYHSMRVVDFCQKISESLNLSDEDISISMLIGLLHDIGRFEQIKRYNTFEDIKSVDHADLGVEILENNNFIAQFVDDLEIQKLVLIAIKNHNKFAIEGDLDDRTLLFCKIIRDADKLDIFNIFIKGDLKISYTDSLISDNVYNCLMNSKSLQNKDIKTDIDYYLRSVGMFFDLNFKYSLEYVKLNGWVDRLMNRIISCSSNEKEKLNDIKLKLNAFLASK